MFDIDNKNLIEIFKNVVQKYKDNIAIVSGEHKLTYSEIDKLSDKVANYLHSKNYGKDDVISIFLPRNSFIPIAILGILKSGAAYLPLNDNYPIDTMIYMHKKANSKVVITSKILGTKLSDDEIYIEDILNNNIISKKPLDIKRKPHDLFSILFTSGSTGKPKGIMVEDKNLLSFISWYIKTFNMGPGVRQVAMANICFDAHMEEFFGCLLSGSTLYIIDEDSRKDLSKIENYCIEHQITHIDMTTQVGMLFVESTNCKTLKYVLVGGESLQPLFPNKWFEFYNTYGPTECTVSVFYFKVDQLYENVPIGKPQDKVKAYVLDKDLNIVKDDTIGELYISGPQVTRGYINDEEKTKVCFIKNPFDDDEDYKILYRTGDLVKKLCDGNYEYHGRIDKQVKIRGFRIELENITRELLNFDGITSATTTTYKYSNEQIYIISYYISKYEIDEQKLIAHLKANLANYMVPNKIIRINTMPLTANGKIDNKALPIPDFTNSKIIEPPKSEEEKFLLDIAKNVISTENIGVTDDLYELGLNSILSMEFISKVNQKYNYRVSDLMRYRNIRDMIHGKSAICYYYSQYDPKKPVMLIVLGIIEFNNIYKKCMLWDAYYNVLIIEDISSHYDKLFKGDSVFDVVEMYNILVSLHLPKDKKIEVAIGYSWGGELAYRMMCEIGKKTGFYGTVIIGDMDLNIDCNKKTIVTKNDVPLDALDKFDNSIEKEITYFQIKFDMIQELEINAAKGKKRLPIDNYYGKIIYIYCNKRKVDDRPGIVEEWQNLCKNTFTLIKLNCTHEEMVVNDEYLPFFENLLAGELKHVDKT